MSLNRARERLIVALDLPSAEQAWQLISELDDLVETYKVGMQLFTAAGPDFVRKLAHRDKKVLLDFKLHEIPNSIAAGVEAAAALGAAMVTVHASAGSAGLRAAVEAAAASSGSIAVLALTVITSMDASGLEEIGVHSSVEEHVLRLALLAKESGCHGIVASPREIQATRRRLGGDIAIAVAGVRPAGSWDDEQARVATPGAAVRAGVNYLMVGRPITASPSPRGAAEGILAEMSAALA